MKTKKDWALYHAKRGFYVFRLVEGGKTPRKKGWQIEATNDPAEIAKLWSGPYVNCNVGGFTSKLDDEACIVVDVDMKRPDVANGDASMSSLVKDGCLFPDTLTQHTPTGGRHIIYRAPWPVKQGAAVLGKGLDIRSRGGFIVMAGSIVSAGEYTSDLDDIADVPAWLFSQLSAAPEHKARKLKDGVVIDPAAARERGMNYLERAPLPEEGQRNDNAYKVAAQLKDLGNDEDVTLELLENEWNILLDEPLEEAELIAVVMSAFAHGQNDQGSKAIENLMEPRELARSVTRPAEAVVEDKVYDHPFHYLNEEFALVVSGGSHHILHETTDQDDNKVVNHIQETSFHRMRSHLTMQVNGKSQPITKMWLNDERARRYQGIVYEPERTVDSRYYNMWKGFPVDALQKDETATPTEQRSFDLWCQHLLENVCGGDVELYNWITCWFADMIQRPWRKPLTSLVFQGEKGVGKNIIVEALCALMAPHYIIADDERYLTSNFNGHLESCSLMAIDEGNWGGDKANEGHLKGLITGKHHNIERKGKESYKVKNILRLIFMSNEKWVVPASFDERRFGVFKVGNKRKQDRAFFSKIVDVNGDMYGIRLLMRHLQNWEINVDVDVAPNTEGLVGQKLASLEPLEQWWFDCLSEGNLVGTLAKNVDFTRVHTDTFNRAFSDYVRGRHIRSRMPTADEMKKTMKKLAPSMTRRKLRHGTTHDFFYTCKGIDVLRADWEEHIGAKLEWEDLNEGEDNE